MVIPHRSGSGPAHRNSTFGSFNVAAERQIGRSGDRPFITWYDDHRGERVELSFKTFDNWVAKTANLLVDELAAEPGDRVGALLVDHWQTVVVLAACWRAGIRVVVLDPEGPETGDLVAVFVREELLAATAGDLAETTVVALTADLLGRGAHDLGGALSYARVVPSMGDLFPGGADPQGAALTVKGDAATMAELLGRAAALADRTGLGGGDRMLSGLPLLSAAGAAAGLVAPLAAGAGVVLVRGLDPARFWKRAAEERVTVAVLDPDQVEALLAAGPPPTDLDRSRLRMVACQGAGAALRDGFRATFDLPLLDA
jgi:uncharacterized protein (TIGR03089 family)